MCVRLLSNTSNTLNPLAGRRSPVLQNYVWCDEEYSPPLHKEELTNMGSKRMGKGTFKSPVQYQALRM